MSAHPRPLALSVLRLLPQDAPLPPRRIAARAAGAGHRVAKVLDGPEDFHVGEHRLSVLLKVLRRAGYARTDATGTWVRTPSGSRQVEVTRAPR